MHGWIVSFLVALWPKEFMGRDKVAFTSLYEFKYNVLSLRVRASQASEVVDYFVTVCLRECKILGLNITANTRSAVKPP